MSRLDNFGLSRRAASMAWGALLVLVAGCTTVVEEAAAPRLPAIQAPQATATLDLAERALYEGRVDDATALLNRAVFNSGSTPRSRLIAAEVQLASGAYQTAAAAFRELTTEEDVRAWALQGEGIALALADGSSESGHASLHAAVDLDPSLSRAWNA